VRNWPLLNCTPLAGFTCPMTDKAQRFYYILRKKLKLDLVLELTSPSNQVSHQSNALSECFGE